MNFKKRSVWCKLIKRLQQYGYFEEKKTFMPVSKSDKVQHNFALSDIRKFPSLEKCKLRTC